MVAFLALLLSSPGAAASLAETGTALRDGVVAPLYRAYGDAAQRLAAVEADCGGAWRERMAPAFADASLAWRRLEATGYGPAANPDTAARVFFWPDKHGTAGRQLGTALRTRDERLTTADGLEGQSAGLQSLAALELLLYSDPGPPEVEAFACRYAQGIADFQASLADRMRRDFEAMSAGAADAETLFRGLLATLDSLLALDLERPLGPSLAEARGTRARTWRSGLSLPLADAALDTVIRLYEAPGGFAALAQSSSPEIAAFGAALGDRLRASRQALAAIGAPLHLAVADPNERPRVEALADELRTVRRLALERLAPALGLAAGFNAMDGD
jgi:predicted lipoprotein